jgi:hypothetical protein
VRCGGPVPHMAEMRKLRVKVKVRFEVLTAVVKSSIFWDITPDSQLFIPTDRTLQKVNLCLCLINSSKGKFVLMLN